MQRLYILFFVLLLLISCQGNRSVESSNPSDKQNMPTYFQVPPFFNGRIVFQSGVDGAYQIYVLDKSGVKKITNGNYDHEYPMWSPDGSTIVFQANPNRKNDYDIYSVKSDGTDLRPVLATPECEGEPAFCSPDGKNIAYTRQEKEVYFYNLDTKTNVPMEPEFKAKSIVPVCSLVSGDIVFTRKRLMGWDVALFTRKTQEIRFLTEGSKSCRARWSHKGDRLAFVSSRADGKGDVWLMNADGSNQSRLTMDDDTYDYYPSWSPDDQYIVYASATHKTKGNWSLWIIEIKTQKKWKIYDSPNQEKFPDWTK